MTLTDREKALVEAGWLFLVEAQAGECPKAKAKFEAALRAYDPPKPKVPVIPEWKDLDADKQYAFRRTMNPTYGNPQTGFYSQSIGTLQPSELWNKVRELTAKDSE